MTAVPPPGISTDHLGIIGTRQLVCVQLFDIARLTSHPIALIPGRFISVTGRGPKDSNESGKTCFLSALSLLLGDPEWKTAGTGASNVAALLFEPITAGVASQRLAAASTGPPRSWHTSCARRHRPRAARAGNTGLSHAEGRVPQRQRLRENAVWTHASSSCLRRQSWTSSLPALFAQTRCRNLHSRTDR